MPQTTADRRKHTMMSTDFTVFPKVRTHFPIRLLFNVLVLSQDETVACRRDHRHKPLTGTDRVDVDGRQTLLIELKIHGLPGYEREARHF